MKNVIFVTALCCASHINTVPSSICSSLWLVLSLICVLPSCSTAFSLFSHPPYPLLYFCSHIPVLIQRVTFTAQSDFSSLDRWFLSLFFPCWFFFQSLIQDAGENNFFFNSDSSPSLDTVALQYQPTFCFLCDVCCFLERAYKNCRTPYRAGLAMEDKPE